MDFSLTLRIFVAIITVVFVVRHILKQESLPQEAVPLHWQQDLENQWPTDSLNLADDDEPYDELHED
ncbi:hypothetical protein LZ554_005862 [Drepanopeziza brunnea f. sp. 'monogermtubi']|nr:hypothetical protein LZ554_005862 [Drepanopeziza brunnea f. sp. 'monogermtubi']